MDEPEISAEIDALLQQAFTEVSKGDAVSKIIFAILAGLCDNDLDGIEVAVNQRRLTLFGLPKEAMGVDAEKKPLSLNERVYFNTSANPMYLRGVAATVVGKYGQKVRVLVDDVAVAKRYRAQTVLVPSDVLSRR